LLSCSRHLWLFILDILAFLLLFIFAGYIHDNSLDEIAFWSCDHWGVHVERLAVDIEEERRGRLDHTWNERVLDKLEMVFLS